MLADFVATAEGFVDVVAEEEEIDFDESIVGVWLARLMRLAVGLDDVEPERKLVFGEAERGRFLSLLKFETPFGLRVVVVGEADLLWFEALDPFSVLLGLFETIVEGVDLDAASFAELAWSFLRILTVGSADFNSLTSCPSLASISMSPTGSVALPLPFLPLSVNADELSAAGLSSPDECFAPFSESAISALFPSCTADSDVEALGDPAAMRCFLGRV